jgi:hypothetical protein
MKAKNVTLWGIIVAVMALLGLEFWTLVNKEKEDTISEVMYEQSKQFLLIPLCLGMLLGHWYWPLTRKKR